MFNISTFNCSVSGNPTVTVYINCKPEEIQYVKSELLNQQGSLIFIGPRVTGSIIVDHTHCVYGFQSIYNMRFITTANGISVTFNHNSERRFLYDEKREYVAKHYINFNTKDRRYM